MSTFNYKLTLLGGQAFNWDEVLPDEYVGFFQDMIVTIHYRRGMPGIHSTFDDIDNWFDNYMFSTSINVSSLDHNDKNIEYAIKKIGEINILKQPFEQTLLSYILATNKNIPAIRSSIRKLSDLLGEKVLLGQRYYTLFPSTQSIANASLESLHKTGIGYRAPYLKQSAQKLLGEGLPKSNDAEDIRRWLITFAGVGPKVADCILLYSFGFTDVIPLDTWMQRIFVERYQIPTNYKYDDIRKWYKDKWGHKAGIIGQYLFEAFRK
jgi:N-glycosylase/DNA lyase